MLIAEDNGTCFTLLADFQVLKLRKCLEDMNDDSPITRNKVCQTCGIAIETKQPSSTGEVFATSMPLRYSDPSDTLQWTQLSRLMTDSVPVPKSEGSTTLDQRPTRAKNRGGGDASACSTLHDAP